MEIQITTKKVKGRVLRNRIESPLGIFKGNTAKWVIQVKIKNYIGQEKIGYHWVLKFGPTQKEFIIEPKRKLEIQPEQLLHWSFIPSLSGLQNLQLLIIGLDSKRDRVLDDYGRHIEFSKNINLKGALAICYHWWFEVGTFRDQILFWFAIVSTVGAIFEILTFFLK